MESAFNADKRLFDNLVSKEEIALELGVTTKTISNWMSAGKIPSIKIGRKNFALRSVLRVWLDSQRKKANRK
ncbi:helix-turn-helix transcriptional regulator [Pseudobacteriovorax antillogorgiicola]|uniref:Helix-turn-helix domain-containing protein n=1 Tax=Pseudobacteriovorax antillogorgiicola TaxID=1513793 RepID=A0A1Y6C3M6_9BACT|nr:helix-turn-helix protein [Pseudobacteriovorax antillogorgiicola]SMF34602.1 Helix-turn-helix domain-containing protein [Pseudobacteriovorax antillogorgiicola]